MAWRDLPPVLLGDVRAAGVPIRASCPHCQHSALISTDRFGHLPDTLELPALGHMGIRCTDCGRRNGISIGADPVPWVQHLKRTGQWHRLPFYGAMIPEDDQG